MTDPIFLLAFASVITLWASTFIHTTANQDYVSYKMGAFADFLSIFLALTGATCFAFLCQEMLKRC